jgi:hypothetical protein
MNINKENLMLDLFVYNSGRYMSAEDAATVKRLFYVGTYNEDYTVLKDIMEVVKACSIVTGGNITAVYKTQVMKELREHPILQKDKDEGYA